MRHERWSCGRVLLVSLLRLSNVFPRQFLEFDLKVFVSFILYSEIWHSKTVQRLHVHAKNKKVLWNLLNTLAFWTITADYRLYHADYSESHQIYHRIIHWSQSGKLTVKYSIEKINYTINSLLIIIRYIIQYLSHFYWIRIRHEGFKNEQTL